MNGLLLGLTSGTACLMFCGPILLPFLASEGKTTVKNYMSLGEFLIGRMVGYILFGILAWFAGKYFINLFNFKELIFGTATIILAVLLFVYSFIKIRRVCAGGYFKKLINNFQNSEKTYLPLLTGFFTGLNLCPQFLLAFTEAADMAYLFQSIFYFFLFFIGTAIWFIPFPFVGILKNIKMIKRAGQILTGIVAVYYLYIGIDKFVIYFS